jgi:hypothetical protein
MNGNRSRLLVVLLAGILIAMLVERDALTEVVGISLWMDSSARLARAQASHRWYLDPKRGRLATKGNRGCGQYFGTAAHKLLKTIGSLFSTKTA